MSHSSSQFLGLFFCNCCDLTLASLETETNSLFYKRAAGFTLSLGRDEYTADGGPDTDAYLAYEDEEVTTWTDGSHSVVNSRRFSAPWLLGEDPEIEYDPPVTTGTMLIRPADTQTVTIEQYRSERLQTIAYHPFPDPAEYRTHYLYRQTLSEPLTAAVFHGLIHEDAAGRTPAWNPPGEGEGADLARSFAHPSGTSAVHKRSRVRAVFPAYSKFQAARVVATEFQGPEEAASGGGLAEEGTPRLISLARFATGSSPEYVEATGQWAGPWTEVSPSRPGAQTFQHGIQLQGRNGLWRVARQAKPFVLMQTRRHTLRFPWKALAPSETNPDLWYKMRESYRGEATQTETAGEWTYHMLRNDPAGDDGLPAEIANFSQPYTLAQLEEDAHAVEYPFSEIKDLGGATYSFDSGEIASFRNNGGTMETLDCLYRVGLPPQQPGPVAMQYRWRVRTVDETTGASSEYGMSWTPVPQPSRAVFCTAYTLAAPTAYGWVSIRQFEQSGDEGATWQPVV